METTKSTFIKTFTGKKIDIFNFKVKDVCIEDIAHALSLICRFGGHSKRFYSVGQHCLEGVEKLDNKQDKYDFLMHDVSEYILNDVCRPIKHKMKEYLEMEENIMIQISEKFSFNYPLPKVISDMDDFMLELEVNELMNGNGTNFLKTYMFPMEVEGLFLKAYEKLSK